MPSRSTVRKLSSNLAIDTPTFCASAACASSVESATPASKAFILVFLHCGASGAPLPCRKTGSSRPVPLLIHFARHRSSGLIPLSGGQSRAHHLHAAPDRSGRIRQGLHLPGERLERKVAVVAACEERPDLIDVAEPVARRHQHPVRI